MVLCQAKRISFSLRNRSDVIRSAIALRNDWGYHLTFRLFLGLALISAISSTSTTPARAWGCLAVTPWVNGDRSVGWGFDAKDRRTQASVAQVALRACESRRAKANPQYPRCSIAGCAPHIHSAAEALAISPP
jgi:hypothetical protein